MRIVFITLLLACLNISHSQELSSKISLEDLEEDSIAAADSSNLILDTGFGLYSRYLWRGVKFGTGPSIQGYMELQHKSGLGIGAYLCSNFSGSFQDFGNTSNIYIWYQKDLGDRNSVKLTLDDYYFYDEDNLDLTFDYSKTTLHYVELRAEFIFNRFDLLGSHSVFQGSVLLEDSTFAQQPVAQYLELGFSLNEYTRFFVGGVTGPSALNFQTKSGITNIGISHIKEVKSIPVETILVVNPSYKNIGFAPGFRQPGRSAISLIVAILI